MEENNEKFAPNSLSVDVSGDDGDEMDIFHYIDLGRNEDVVDLNDIKPTLMFASETADGVTYDFVDEHIPGLHDVAAYVEIESSQPDQGSVPESGNTVSKTEASTQTRTLDVANKPN